MSGYKQTLLDNGPLALYSFDGITDYTDKPTFTGIFTDETDQFPPAQLIKYDALSSINFSYSTNSLIGTESFGDQMSFTIGVPAENNSLNVNTSGCYLQIDPDGYELPDFDPTSFTLMFNLQTGSVSSTSQYSTFLYSADVGRNMSFNSMFGSIMNLIDLRGNYLKLDGLTGESCHMEFEIAADTMSFSAFIGENSQCSDQTSKVFSQLFPSTNTYTTGDLKVQYLPSNGTVLNNYILNWDPIFVSVVPISTNTCSVTIQMTTAVGPLNYNTYNFITVAGTVYTVAVVGSYDVTMNPICTIYVNGLAVKTFLTNLTTHTTPGYTTNIKYIGQKISWDSSSFSSPVYKSSLFTTIRNEVLNITKFPMVIDNVCIFDKEFYSEDILDLFFKSMTYDQRILYNGPTNYYKFDEVYEYVTNGYLPFNVQDDARKVYLNTLTTDQWGKRGIIINNIPDVGTNSARELAVYQPLDGATQYTVVGDSVIETAISLKNGSHLSTYTTANDYNTSYTNLVSLSSNFTIMFWMKTNAYNGTLLAVCDQFYPYKGVEIHLKSGTAYINVNGTDYVLISQVGHRSMIPGGGIAYLPEPTIINDDTYHHYALRLSAGILTLWVDGWNCFTSDSVVNIAPSSNPSQQLSIANNLPRNNGLDCDIALFTVYQKAIQTPYIGAYYRSYTQYNIAGVVRLTGVGISVPIRIYNHTSGEMIIQLSSDTAGDFNWKNDYLFPVDIIFQNYQNTGFMQVLGPIYPSP